MKESDDDPDGLNTTGQDTEQKRYYKNNYNQRGKRGSRYYQDGHYDYPTHGVLYDYYGNSGYLDSYGQFVPEGNGYGAYDAQPYYQEYRQPRHNRCGRGSYGGYYDQRSYQPRDQGIVTDNQVPKENGNEGSANHSSNQTGANGAFGQIDGQNGGARPKQFSYQRNRYRETRQQRSLNLSSGVGQEIGHEPTKAEASGSRSQEDIEGGAQNRTRKAYSNLRARNGRGTDNKVVDVAKIETMKSERGEDSKLAEEASYSEKLADNPQKEEDAKVNSNSYNRSSNRNGKENRSKYTRESTPELNIAKSYQQLKPSKTKGSNVGRENASYNASNRNSEKANNDRRMSPRYENDYNDYQSGNRRSQFDERDSSEAFYAQSGHQYERNAYESAREFGQEFDEHNMTEKQRRVLARKQAEAEKMSKRDQPTKSEKKNGKDVSSKETTASKDDSRHRFTFKRKINDEDRETQRGALIEQLLRGVYECMVCCDVIVRQAAVWSCCGCYNVFHLRCICKWARSPVAAVDDGAGGGWRCPACQNACAKVPGEYRCFCGRVRDPEATRHDTPHSCGELCRKARGEQCSHPCNILCHPGPCPDCQATVTRQCHCGQSKLSLKCAQSADVSCQSECRKMLNCGRHECTQVCHKGACEPCEESVKQVCYCGKERRKVVCGSAESFTSTFCCQQPCERKLDCGNHFCDVTCHPGTCDPCRLLPEQVLYCACLKTPLNELQIHAPTEQIQAPLERLQAPFEAFGNDKRSLEEETGLETDNNRSLFSDSLATQDDVATLSAEEPCSSASDAIGIHNRAKKTSENDSNSSDVASFSAEGTNIDFVDNESVIEAQSDIAKMDGSNLSSAASVDDKQVHISINSLSVMSSTDAIIRGVVRTSCLDPVPTCDNVCDKERKCGPADAPHKCTRLCHVGACGPCELTTSVRCRCGAVCKSVPCAELQQFTDGKVYTCGRRCQKKLYCGRHKCPKLCCVDTEHKCDTICNKKLSCGLHRCEDPCHRGNCPRCWQVSFDELACYCGAEVIMPPVQCGTKPPECRKPCSRLHPCGHEPQHPCHSAESCPPCPSLTERWCLGGHELRHNIPCHVTEVSCGMPCLRPVACGHRCQRTCHKGECADGSERACTQPCITVRPLCGHPCALPCHADNTCPPLSCRVQVLLSCECGYRQEKATCQLETAGLQDLQRFAMSGQQSGGTIDISDLTRVRPRQRRLECTAECAIRERNKRLAEALSVTNPDLTNKPAAVYGDWLKEFARKNLTFAASIERAFAELVNTAQNSSQKERKHAFSSMKSEQRRFVHELAPFYGCATASYDSEPQRNVVATTAKATCTRPSLTLTATVQRELHPKAPTPIPHHTSETHIRSNQRASNQSTAVLGPWGVSTPRANSSAPKPSSRVGGTGGGGMTTLSKKSSTSNIVTDNARSPSPQSSMGWGAVSNPVRTTTSAWGNSAAAGSDRFRASTQQQQQKPVTKKEPVIDYFDMTD